LLQRMLEAEGDDNSDFTNPTFDIRFISLLVKALAITLQRSLVLSDVDDSTCCAIYSCLFTLSTMPATAVTSDSKVSVIKWLQAKVIAASEVDSLISLSLVEKYLVNQLYWFHDLGHAILMSSVDDILTFRKKLCDAAMLAETEDQRFPVWDIAIPRQSLIADSNDLNELELLMFPRSSFDRRSVLLNTYVSKLSISNQQLKVWVPSRTATRCIEKLITSFARSE
jgi:hypothetical protein